MLVFVILDRIRNGACITESLAKFLVLSAGMSNICIMMAAMQSIDKEGFSVWHIIHIMHFGIFVAFYAKIWLDAPSPHHSEKAKQILEWFCARDGLYEPMIDNKRKCILFSYAIAIISALHIIWSLYNVVFKNCNSCFMAAAIIAAPINIALSIVDLAHYFDL